jgi:hypothetical protein
MAIFTFPNKVKTGKGALGLVPYVGPQRRKNRNQRFPRAVYPTVDGRGFFNIGGLVRDAVKSVVKVADVLPKGTLKKVGGLVGGAFGPKGAALGAGLGHGISTITGRGDYQVKRNSITLTGDTPKFGNGSECIHIRHSEYISDVVTGSGNPSPFTTQTFPLNPGLGSTFPWASNIAAQFSEYEIIGMLYEYRPTSGMVTGAVNPAIGVVGITTQYNSYALDLQNKQQADAHQYTTSCLPYERALHAIECAPKLTSTEILYIRTGENPSGTDLRLYDLGKTTVWTQGMPATAPYTIGELWVTYDIKLTKPRIATTLTCGGITASTSFASTTTLFANFAKTAGDNVVDTVSGPGLRFRYQGFYRCSLLFGSVTPITDDLEMVPFDPQRTKVNYSETVISSDGLSAMVQMGVTVYASISNEADDRNVINGSGLDGATTGTCGIYASLSQL